VASLNARREYFVQRHNLAMTQAYYTAALSRWNGKKRVFPSLKSLLIDSDRPRRTLTVDEQWQRLLSIVPTRTTVN
jgi:hypothetical protein